MLQAMVMAVHVKVNVVGLKLFTRFTGVQCAEMGKLSHLHISYFLP